MSISSAIDRIARHVAFDEFRIRIAPELGKRVIELGLLALVAILVRDGVGLVGRHEARVFDAVAGRAARPADIERILDLGLALGTDPHGPCPRLDAPRFTRPVHHLYSNPSRLSMADPGPRVSHVCERLLARPTA
jgi:hypothetical protein